MAELKEFDKDLRSICGVAGVVIGTVASVVVLLILVIGAFFALGFLGGLATLIGLAFMVCTGFFWVAGNGDAREGIRWMFS